MNRKIRQAGSATRQTKMTRSVIVTVGRLSCRRRVFSRSATDGVCKTDALQEQKSHDSFGKLKTLLASGLLALGIFSPNFAAAAEAPTIVLPPMLVEESKSTVPWYYVNLGATEFLSRCSESTTWDFVRAWQEKTQLMHVLVPEEFLARSDAPSVIVLYAQDLDQTFSAEIQRDLQATAAAKGDKSEQARVNLAPNMRLGDRDMHATIVYINESVFQGAQLNIAAGHVRYLMQGRTPELPPWLVEGVERLWRHANFAEDPITLTPLVWHDETESYELAGNPARPRPLLPAAELFAPVPVRDKEVQHPRRVQTRAAQQELFVRWALTSSDAHREALWKFAARAAEAPVTEEMFEACFGFDFAELRDRLSDYLPKAVEDTEWIDPGDLPEPPRFKVEKATPNEIARVRGEWERLAIWHVQRRYPQAREPYIAQARRTLQRAYKTGDRDPRLLATMGLTEIDAGNPAGAREFLEPAVAASVLRPNAYIELARLRFADLRRGAPETKLFTATELAPVIKPLQQSLKQAPPLADAYMFLAQAWARCEAAPNATERGELETGAKNFPWRPTVAYPVAQVLARHGKKTEAAAVLDACVGYPAEQDIVEGMKRLRAEMPGSSVP